MANNKQPIARRCRALDVSPAAMGYANKKSKRNPGGQRSKTNARTRKGPKRTVGNKKK